MGLLMTKMLLSLLLIYQFKRGNVKLIIPYGIYLVGKQFNNVGNATLSNYVYVGSPSSEMPLNQRVVEFLCGIRNYTA